MAKYQLLLPKMGESVAEATIIKWTKNPGDYIEADEAVMEIATDKVDSEVPSPVSGKLIEQLFKEDDIVQVGSVIAIIETDAKETEAAPAAQETKPEPVKEAEPVVAPQHETEPDATSRIPGMDQLEEKAIAEPNTSGAKFENRFYSPLVKNIALQEGINTNELETIPGTGAEGRLTKDDLLEYIQKRGSRVASPQVGASGSTTEQAAPHPEVLKYAAAIPAAQAAAKTTTQATPAQPAQPTAAPAAPAKTVSMSGGDEIIEMDRMRKLIADHMVMSKQTSPHVTSFVEADVTSLVQWRDKVKGPFEKREGEKITFTPIFIEAVVHAIKQLPMINVQVNGTQIIKKKNINISMATALPSGNLIVPVIKQADQLNLLGITKAVNDLANRARNNKLQPDDVKDGTFTLTNVGSFGNVMGTPIINQPQVAILAVGAIKKKPAVIETAQGDAIAIRHMMFLSLSYDHRVVDGALGGMFVKKVADYLENWDINRNI
ncbi:dihydrolipoamide acetyltransferase family protein [Mucilaginibacter sp.]|uniref:dihydrolipoamide acetyltransferase family protein n=1 Tax=Mucilaginibacter sp. TaxID=1882438 RepID=UPI0035BC6CE9